MNIENRFYIREEQGVRNHWLLGMKRQNKYIRDHVEHHTSCT